MTEGLDECILNRLVGVGRVVQLLVRNAHGPALMNGHEFCEALACRIERAVDNEVANLDRNPRVVRQRRRNRPAIPDRDAEARCRRGTSLDAGSGSMFTTHIFITLRVGNCLQCSPESRSA